MYSTIALALLAALAGDDPPRPTPAPTGVRVSGPMEVRVSYRPRIDKSHEQAIVDETLKKAILYYEPAWVADSAIPRGEVLGRLRIAGAKVADDGDTLVLATDPHPRRAVYVLDWIMSQGGRSPTCYLYSGVQWDWHFGADEPPLPSASMTISSLRDFSLRRGYGGQAMSKSGYPSKVVLWSDLLPPKGRETLVLRGNMSFTATLGNRELESKLGDDKLYRIEAEIDSQGDPIELATTLTTGKIGPDWEFSTLWRRDGKEEPVPSSQLAFPWMPPEKPALAAPAPPFNLAGGDPTKGEEVFRSEAAKCATCHAIGGKGGAVGPTLEGQKGRPLADVYNAISEPSATIAPEFRTYTIARKSGEIAVGIVRAEGCDAIRVADINGQATIIPKADIENMQPSGASTMPVGLAAALGEAKMRDLLAFLTKGN